MAIAVGIRACEENYRVIFRTASALINEMIEARNENRLSLYIRQFKKIDLLIIDEFGYVTFDLAGAELLFQLLATRYETMSTIITSNLAFSDWVKGTIIKKRLDGGGFLFRLLFDLVWC
jgi:DNA replication protein DnaC